MKVLVTGNLGYIGTKLTTMLTHIGEDVSGLDAGFFEDCLLEDVPLITTNKKDIRDVELRDFDGFDAVIHLAGLSNDPLGELNPSLTEEINFFGTMRVAELAKKAGVQRFVYASSQSMYGVSGSNIPLDEDASDKNPVTAYARTKWEAEQQMRFLNSEKFVTVFIRPSTVFGYTPRLRSDIVFNNLVGSGYTCDGCIEIKSDGTPWRPVVHVEDVCAAFIAGLKAPALIVNGRAYNVGVPNGNYTVKDLAEAAARAIPNAKVIYTAEHRSDSRTYRVSFDRILSELKEWYRPKWTLDMGAAELIRSYGKIGFTKSDFTGPQTIRLAKLRQLLGSGIIGDDLRFKKTL
jgi:nucleoside-diphosphate-sugar epimerase